MKYRNRIKRLKARQDAYDKLMQEHPEYKGSYTRPGSLNK